MNSSLKCHQDEKLNALIGKRVKITFWDRTVEDGILMREVPYPYQINYLAFYKSHVKKNRGGINMNDEMCREYKTAVAEFEKYCADEVGLNVDINTDKYPMTVTLTPADTQQSMFDEAEEADGASGCIVITNGIETKIKANLQYQMDAALLKKLITKVENLGKLYLHAFRAQVMEKMYDETSPKGLIACLKDLCNIK